MSNNEYNRMIDHAIPTFKFPAHWNVQLLPTEISIVAFKASYRGKSVTAALYDSNSIRDFKHYGRSCPYWEIKPDRYGKIFLLAHTDTDELIKEIDGVLLS